MSGLISEFTQKTKHVCSWSKKNGNDEWGKPAWLDSVIIPCVFFTETKVTDAKSGGVFITPAQLYVDARHTVLVGDKIEFRGNPYVIESIEILEWFGGVRDGYKCACKQEGGVAP